MVRTIMAATAMAAMVGGAAAQYTASPAGLTPGAPLTKDPVTGDPVRAGEDGFITGQTETQRQAAAIPAADRGMALPNPAPSSCFDHYPGQSGIGLTPGVPLGTGTHKAVVCGMETRGP